MPGIQDGCRGRVWEYSLQDIQRQNGPPLRLPGYPVHGSGKGNRERYKMEKPGRKGSGNEVQYEDEGRYCDCDYKNCNRADVNRTLILALVIVDKTGG